ncbi:hypothetical protein MQH10_08400, partial [Phenylobacterium aquaticum]|nr:hypothetical protein [Phenylobacterium aquaticum]
MAAGPTIAAQTAQAPGVAGAGASSGAGLFGKSTTAHGTAAGFDSLLAAFFGNQAANPIGATAGVLTAAAAKAAAAQASGETSAKSADDKTAATDAAPTADGATAATDAASTALLYMLAGQTAPTLPQPAAAGAAKTADGTAATDDVLQGGGKPSAAPGSALAQAARLAQAATGDEASAQPDGGDIDAAAGEAPANLTPARQARPGPADRRRTERRVRRQGRHSLCAGCVDRAAATAPRPRA